jgi:dTDP-4-dehydrorhamnose reductase
LVGSNVVQTFEDQGHETWGTYLTSSADTGIRLDKTDAAEVSDVVAEAQPDIIVDAAAFHAVDECETKRDTAWTVNATGTRNVAVAANEAGAHLVYLSTDYVFPGDTDTPPYRESDPVDPINYYAEAKYGGEQAAKIADRVTVLRPSVIYGLANANFVTWVLGELRDGNDIGIVDDQVSRPTYAPDLASACLAIARQKITGLYHATGPESLSRYEFTIRLAEVYGFDTKLVSPISTEELGQTAPRPTDSSLDSNRLYDVIDTEFRTPTAAFEEMHTQS